MLINYPPIKYQPCSLQIYLMMSNHEDVTDGYCQCTICSAKPPPVAPLMDQSHHAAQTGNCLLNFLELLPKSFPISVTPTAAPKNRVFFFNRFGNRLMITPFTKILDHFPLAVNIVLFYPLKTIVAHKYQVNKEEPNFIYLQAHNPNVPFIIDYRNDEQFMDQVLTEKLASLIKNTSTNDNYELSSSEKDFFLWVHKDYNDMIFCKYMTKFYCAFIEKIRKDLVVSGKFEWIIEKPGSIRLSNVKDLIIEKSKRCATFQEQYEQKILEKLNVKESTEVKLFSTFVQKSKINFRISNFRNQIRQIFNHEKLKILKNTEKERTVETKTLSDDVARLFLPQLHKYSNLREVLNDQSKFKKVVLGIDEEIKPKKGGHFGRPSAGSEMSKINKVKARHYRSKSQM